MAFGKQQEQVAIVKEPNIVRTVITIKGTAPLVVHKFSKKQKEKMMSDMSRSKAEKKGKSERAPRNYEEDFKQAQHVSTEGWNGIPCSAFRAAMIDACRTVGIVMTRAKMSVFVEPDGFDADEGTPLVKIHGQPPERTEMLVRNDNGSADIRIRPMWREWKCELKLSFDADMITPESVVNLLARAGLQVGVCEGRPYSKNSVGQGWGTFAIANAAETKAAA